MTIMRLIVIKYFNLLTVLLFLLFNLDKTVQNFTIIHNMKTLIGVLLWMTILLLSSHYLLFIIKLSFNILFQQTVHKYWWLILNYTDFCPINLSLDLNRVSFSNKSKHNGNKSQQNGTSCNTLQTSHNTTKWKQAQHNRNKLHHKKN